VAVWKKVKVGDFLFEREGRYKPDAKEIQGLQRIDKIDFSGNFHVANKPSKTDMILIKSGDLVISGINVAKGALGVYHGDADVTATIHYSSYTFDESKVSVEFFKRFLKSPIFIQSLKEQVKGGIKTEIKPKHLLPLEIMLPDKDEQLSILSQFQRIENEDAELKHELTRQQALLKKLRQHILQEAVEGKLTAGWRAQNPDVEPASELLKRIAAEKAQLVKDKKIKAQKPLPPITDEEKPFELPLGWEWCRLGDLGVIQGGGTPSKSVQEFWDGDIPWICPKDMKRKYLKSSIFQITPEAVKNSSAKIIDERSILFVVRGMILSHTFPVSINTKNVTVNQDMKALTPYIIGIDEFIALSLTGSSKSILKRVRTSTHGTCRLESDVYFNWPIALPTYEEQQKILVKVEKLLALCDELETQITQNQTHAEQLMQAVLKEAFSRNSEAEPAAKESKVSADVPEVIRA